MYTDLSIDTSTGDIAFPTRMLSGSQATRQRIDVRLRTFYGEWLLDTSVGLPYATWAQEKPAQPAAISARVRAEVAGTPGVQAVTSWAYTWDKATGALSMTGEVRIDGVAQSVPISVDMPARGANTFPHMMLML